MGFILDGKSQGSPLCQDLMSRYSKGMVRESGIPAVMQFGVENAFLEFDSPANRCRPYLMLLGRPQEITGEFPYGATTVRYQDTEERSLVAYRYDLTRQNLAAMVAKGLFDEGFAVPEIVRENVFELPCRVTCTALKPEEKGMAPVVFADIEAASLQCTDDTSGYTISDYFQPVPEPSPEELLAPEQQKDDLYGKTLRSQSAVYQGVMAEPKSDAPAAGHQYPTKVPEPEEKEEKPVKRGEATPKRRDVSDVKTPDAGPEDRDEELFI